MPVCYLRNGINPPLAPFRDTDATDGKFGHLYSGWACTSPETETPQGGWEDEWKMPTDESWNMKVNGNKVHDQGGTGDWELMPEFPKGILLFLLA